MGKLSDAFIEMNTLAEQAGGYFALPSEENIEYTDLLFDVCKLYAQRTSERSVYHLYSRTEHFNVWLRMITRERDYNLYVNYYLRDSVQDAE